MLHILFVCTGNTCRSPMAKAIFQPVSEKYGIDSIFSSAGLAFCYNKTVSPNSVTVCNEIGIDISGHIPRTLREHDLDVTDIFVVMTNSHAEAIFSLGIPQNKIYILGGGIDDPYGSDLVTYRRCRNQITEGLEEFCKFLKKKIDTGTLKEHQHEKYYDNRNEA